MVRVMTESHIPRPEAAGRARLLLDHCIGLRYAHLMLPGRTLTASQQSWLNSSLERVVARYPVAYLTGRREFFGREFTIGEGVLVPRPETELLVEAALQRIPANTALQVADLGTGSGCIGITLALERPCLQVWATELEAPARRVCAQNTIRWDIGARYHLVPGKADDWAGPVLAAGACRLHLVVSNPPYISTAEFSQLQTEIRCHEPRLALLGGPDGLQSYRALAVQTGRLLAPGGWLLLEMGAGQAEQVQAILRQAGWNQIRVVPDLAGISRVVEARWG